MNVRVSSGPKAIYPEHGVWQEGNRIHVTIPGPREHHVSYGPGQREFEAYKALLLDYGRWVEESAQ